MANEVLYEVADKVAVITLNRPEKRNALNAAMRQGLWDACRRFEADGNADICHYGDDAPRLVDELVPCFASVVDEIIVGFEAAVGEPVIAHNMKEQFSTSHVKLKFAA